MDNATKTFETKLRKRIALRMSQGWSLEKIGARTVWTMFGHLYSIKDGALIVRMAGGNETFRPTAPETFSEADIPAEFRNLKEFTESESEQVELDRR